MTLGRSADQPTEPILHPPSCCPSETVGDRTDERKSRSSWSMASLWHTDSSFPTRYPLYSVQWPTYGGLSLPTCMCRYPIPCLSWSYLIADRCRKPPYFSNRDDHLLLQRPLHHIFRLSSFYFHVKANIPLSRSCFPTDAARREQQPWHLFSQYATSVRILHLQNSASNPIQGRGLPKGG